MSITCRLLNIRSLSSQVVLGNDQISDYHINLFSLAETWLGPEYASVDEATPPSHSNTHIPRGMGWGDGVAAFFSFTLLINPKPELNCNSFESLFLTLSHPNWKSLQPVIFVVVYRVPGPYSEFLNDFSEFLSSLDLKSDIIVEVIIVEEFNICMDFCSDCLSTALVITRLNWLHSDCA